MAQKKGKEKDDSHSLAVDPAGEALNCCADRSSPNQFAASAASLLNSLIQPTASEICSLLQDEGQSSKSQAFRSSSPLAEDTRLSRQSAYSAIGETSIGFNEPRATPVSTVNRDFQRFFGDTSPPILGTQSSEDMQTVPPTVPPAQSHPEDIIQILSSSSLTADIWDTGPGDSASQTSLLTIKQNLQNAQVVEFLSTSDVVEFLSREDAIYTEEVWGDMAQVLHEAQKEVADFRNKGKGKKQDTKSDALARLQMLRSQLRSKL